MGHKKQWSTGTNLGGHKRVCICCDKPRVTRHLPAGAISDAGTAATGPRSPTPAGQPLRSHLAGQQGTGSQLLAVWWENWCHLLKPLGSQEVEQVEELFQVVLERSPGEQQLVIDLVAV